MVRFLLETEQSYVQSLKTIIKVCGCVDVFCLPCKLMKCDHVYYMYLWSISSGSQVNAIAHCVCKLMTWEVETCVYCCWPAQGHCSLSSEFISLNWPFSWQLPPHF